MPNTKLTLFYCPIKHYFAFCYHEDHQHGLEQLQYLLKANNISQEFYSSITFDILETYDGNHINNWISSLPVTSSEALYISYQCFCDTIENKNLGGFFIQDISESLDTNKVKKDFMHFLIDRFSKVYNGE